MTTPPHPSNYGRFLAAIQEAGELLDRIASATPAAWQHIVDAVGGQPGAQAFDAERDGPGSVVVCTRHERDITDCQREDLVGCTGAPIPRRSDPTGSAGTSHDPASMDLRALHRHADTIRRQTEAIVHVMARYTPRPANDYERRLTAAQNDDPGCESCSRVPSQFCKDIPHYSPVERRVRLGTLGHPVGLCSWCRKWHGEHGALPPREVLEAHVRGEKIRRSA